MKPIRIQLSRAKGWRMPPNTVKVDRTTKWGNPFIVGEHGTAIECVYWFCLVAGGYINVSKGSDCADRQKRFIEDLAEESHMAYPSLRGKNLACWCQIGKPCHADVLLRIINRPYHWQGVSIHDLVGQYGYRIVEGKLEPTECAR